jgi:hypothetical protein
MLSLGATGLFQKKVILSLGATGLFQKKVKLSLGATGLFQKIEKDRCVRVVHNPHLGKKVWETTIIPKCPLGGFVDSLP